MYILSRMSADENKQKLLKLGFSDNEIKKVDKLIEELYDGMRLRRIHDLIKSSKSARDTKKAIFLKEEIMNRVKAEQLEKHISFLGFRKDVPQLLKSLDVFLMTSKTEGLGSVILEAFACGVPVVATTAGGIPEIVKNGETGLTVNIGDETALASAVEKIIANPDYKNSLVKNATAFVNQFSVKATALQTKAIYQSLLK